MPQAQGVAHLVLGRGAEDRLGDGLVDRLRPSSLSESASPAMASSKKVAISMLRLAKRRIRSRLRALYSFDDHQTGETRLCKLGGMDISGVSGPMRPTPFMATMWGSDISMSSNSVSCTRASCADDHPAGRLKRSMPGL